MSHPPYVFVHGLIGPFADADTFAHLAPAPCSAPDLVGYGTRDSSPTVTTAAQVAALAQHVESEHPATPVHLVAHSIGAVYAFLYADAAPDRVAGVTTVEGNFSLADAFWSGSIAKLDAAEAQPAIERRLADPAAFLKSDGVPVGPAMLNRARAALSYQPWRTVWESARAVVATTGSSDYERLLKRVFSQTDVFLIAGQRSAAGWNVPTWARDAAAGAAVVAGTGHMMMLEDPNALGRSLAGMRHSSFAG